MDIALLNPGTLRIKGKNSTLIIDPNSSTGKNEADGVIVLNSYENFSVNKIEGYRIIIKGPGEYEVGGTKISALSFDKNLIVKMDVDGVKVLIGDGASIEKLHDKLEETQILVINSDLPFNDSILASLEPNVFVVYGNKKEEVIKTIGKDEPVKVAKYSTASDKLPQELEVVSLN